MGACSDVLKDSCPTGWRYHGIDWSDRAVERIRRKGYDGRSGDIASLDLTEWDGRFDLALMHQLIEHVRDPRAILAKVRRMLKPGGVLSVETPDIDAWDFRLLSRRYWAGYDIPRHFYIFNKTNFAELAREVGFEVVSTASLVNPVFWIHPSRATSPTSRCCAVCLLLSSSKRPHAGVVHAARAAPDAPRGTSSNMQINLRRVD